MLSGVFLQRRLFDAKYLFKPGVLTQLFLSSVIHLISLLAAAELKDHPIKLSIQALRRLPP